VLELTFNLVMHLSNLCAESLFEFIFELEHSDPQFFIASPDLSFNSSNTCLIRVPNYLKLGLMRVDELVVMLVGIDD